MNRLLQPSQIDALSGLRFRLPKMIERGHNGSHQTSQKGTSVEFSQHRDYAPGDPIRSLDWKAYARSERYVVKEFESDSNLNVIIALDRSASMSFPEDATSSKFAFACRLVHGLTWLLLQQGDSVGLLTFSDNEPNYLPPSSAGDQLLRVEETLTSTALGGLTSFNILAEFITVECSRNTICVFISDLLDEEAAANSTLVRLKQQRYPVYCIHTLSEEELSLKEDEPTIFVDPESRASVLTEPNAISSAYKETITQWLDETQSECVHNGIHYLFSRSDADAVSVLRKLLGQQGL